MKIAILTFHRSFNCGAILQAWALSRVLSSFGHKCEFPDCNNVRVGRFSGFPNWSGPIRFCYYLLKWSWRMIGSLWFYDCIRWKTDLWRKKNICTCHINPSKIGVAYDMAVVGSDQVWNCDIDGESTPLFLGENLPEKFPIVGYAVSFGDERPKGKAATRVVAAARRMRGLSVREPLVNDFLHENGVQNSYPVVLDPTLLLDQKEYFSVMDRRKLSESYLFVYALTIRKELYEIVHEVARRLHLRCVITTVYQTSKTLVPSDVLLGVSPGDFLSYVKYADYVIADSFHGVVFCELFQKKFCAYNVSAWNMSPRSAALLKSLGEDYRLVTGLQSVDEVVNVILESPRSLALDRLLEIRKKSLKWFSEIIGQVEPK